MGKDVNEIYEPVGCDKCISGYKGRIAVHEVLVIDQEIRDAIIDNVSKDELRHLCYKRDDLGANTLLYDGLEKVSAGYTSFEEILRIIDIDEDLGDEDIEIKKALIGHRKTRKLEEDQKTDIKDNNTNTTSTSTSDSSSNKDDTLVQNISSQNNINNPTINNVGSNNLEIAEHTSSPSLSIFQSDDEHESKQLLHMNQQVIQNAKDLLRSGMNNLHGTTATEGKSTLDVDGINKDVDVL